MIIKRSTPERKKNPIIGIFLFLIAIVLMIATGPLGLIYGLLHRLFIGFISGIGEYCLQIAVSIDQLGNVIMQHLLNLLWIKRNSANKFGNADETISSVLGKNQLKCTLTVFGKLINSILDSIDPDHTLNSIEYEIK